MNAGRPLSIVLLMFGMLWIVVMLMQDFDLAGGKKAIMLLGLAVATVGVTWAVEGNGLSARSSSVLLAGLGIVLAVFAVLTPSRLSAAETLAAIALAAVPLALRALGVRSPVGLDGLPAILTALCIAQIGRAHV